MNKNPLKTPLLTGFIFLAGMAFAQEGKTSLYKNVRAMPGGSLGDMIVVNDSSGNMVPLAVGSNGQCLLVVSGRPAWGACPSTGVGGLAAGTVLFSDGSNVTGDSTNFTWDPTNHVLTSSAGFNSGIAGGMLFQMANDTSTGTAAGKLVKSSSGKAVTILTTDKSGILGVCLLNCGTAGTATIATGIFAPCQFDGGTTADHYIVASTTAAGKCHDAGSSVPTLNQIVGRIFATNGGAGTYSAFFYSPDNSSSSGTITGVTAGTGLSGGGSSGPVTVSLSTPVSIANGGTNATTFTAGSIPFYDSSGGGKFGEDNNGLFWDKTNRRLCVRCQATAARYATDLYGQTSVQGAFYLQQAGVPTFTISQVGTAGTTAYQYRVAANYGSLQSVSSTIQTTTGNGVLTGSNFNRLTFTSIPSGATSLSIYRVASAGSPATTGLIGTASATAATFDDTGLSASGTSPAALANSTGYFGVGDTAPQLPIATAPDYQIGQEMEVPAGMALAQLTAGGTLGVGTYYYVVTAVDPKGGESRPSAEVNLPIASGSTNAILLTWNDVLGAASYKVYRSSSAGTETFLGNSGSAFLLDTGTTPGATLPPTVSNAFATYFAGQRNYLLGQALTGASTFLGSHAALGINGFPNRHHDLEVYGLAHVSGKLEVGSLSAPFANLLAQSAGNPGATTYTYYVCLLFGTSMDAQCSSATSNTAGNASLSVTNFNVISWDYVPGTAAVKVWKTVGPGAQGLITCAQGSLSFCTDQTGVGDGTTGPGAGTDSTGGLSFGGHLTASGGTPNGTCTGCGSGFSITFAAGSSDAAGTMEINTGTGPSASGTATLVFATPFGTNLPVVIPTLVNGTTTWNARATVISTLPTTAHVDFNWDNNSVALGASQTPAVRISYIVVGK
jgi:hypothetical protein